jgi:hypothetical protein
VNFRPKHSPHKRDLSISSLAAGLALAVVYAASPQAKAVDVAVGSYGLYDPLQKSGVLSVAARTGLDSLFNFEARAGYGVPNGSKRASDLVKTIVSIAEEGSGDASFQQEIHFDRFLLEGLVDLSPKRELGRTQVVPHIRMGTGLLFRNTYYAVFNETDENFVGYEEVSNSVLIPFIGEVTVELWSLHSFGVRFCAGFMANIQKEYKYDPDTPHTGKTIINTRARMGLDILYAAGARR